MRLPAEVYGQYDFAETVYQAQTGIPILVAAADPSRVSLMVGCNTGNNFSLAHSPSTLLAGAGILISLPDQADWSHLLYSVRVCQEWWVLVPATQPVTVWEVFLRRKPNQFVSIWNT
jgi:hypothetical protein